MATFFYIVNKQTGEWLPYAKNKNQTSAKLTFTDPPRLFRTIRQAQQCLTWWLHGISFMDYRDSFEGGEYDLRTKPVESRKKEDMDIVEITIPSITNRYDMEVLNYGTS